jgi:predicted AAA+ superfamily ATPase
MYIFRYLEDEVNKISDSFKTLYIGGPRQVGKTTLLKKLAKEKGMNYVTLDDLEIRNLAINEPKLFIKQFQAPLLIDEIQYAPEIFPYLKIEVDSKNQNGMYWITGSQHYSIIKNLQESLAGRVAIMSLNTLSHAEIDELNRNPEPFLPRHIQSSKTYKDQDIFERILRGGFPALATDPKIDVATFFSSYTQTYIEKDLVNLFGIQNSSRFYNFMRLCADRTGQMLNYSDLARDAGIAVTTAKDWVEILAGTMQIYLLPSYNTNFSKRIIKSPKLYFMDTGLAAYLTGWRSINSLKNSVYAGRLFETFVVSEIIKSYLYRAKTPPLYYFRDKEGHEIDLLIENDNLLYPIEIKSGAAFKSDYLNNINYFYQRQKNISSSGIIMNSDRSYEVKEGVYVINAKEID